MSKIYNIKEFLSRDACRFWEDYCSEKTKHGDPNFRYGMSSFAMLGDTHSFQTRNMSDIVAAMQFEANPNFVLASQNFGSIQHMMLQPAERLQPYTKDGKYNSCAIVTNPPADGIIEFPLFANFGKGGAGMEDHTPGTTFLNNMKHIEDACNVRVVDEVNFTKAISDYGKKVQLHGETAFLPDEQTFIGKLINKFKAMKTPAQYFGKNPTDDQLLDQIRKKVFGVSAKTGVSGTILVSKTIRDKNLSEVEKTLAVVDLFSNKVSDFLQKNDSQTSYPLAYFSAADKARIVYAGQLAADMYTMLAMDLGKENHAQMESYLRQQIANTLAGLQDQSHVATQMYSQYVERITSSMLKQFNLNTLDIEKHYNAMGITYIDDYQAAFDGTMGFIQGKQVPQRTIHNIIFGRTQNAAFSKNPAGEIMFEGDSPLFDAMQQGLSFDDEQEYATGFTPTPTPVTPAPDQQSAQPAQTTQQPAIPPVVPTNDQDLTAGQSPDPQNPEQDASNNQDPKAQTAQTFNYSGRGIPAPEFTGRGAGGIDWIPADDEAELGQEEKPGNIDWLLPEDKEENEKFDFDSYIQGIRDKGIKPNAAKVLADWQAEHAQNATAQPSKPATQQNEAANVYDELTTTPKFDAAKILADWQAEHAQNATAQPKTPQEKTEKFDFDSYIQDIRDKGIKPNAAKVLADWQAEHAQNATTQPSKPVTQQDKSASVYDELTTTPKFDAAKIVADLRKEKEANQSEENEIDKDEELVARREIAAEEQAKREAFVARHKTAEPEIQINPEVAELFGLLDKTLEEEKKKASIKEVSPSELVELPKVVRQYKFEKSLKTLQGEKNNQAEENEIDKDEELVARREIAAEEQAKREASIEKAQQNRRYGPHFNMGAYIDGIKAKGQGKELEENEIDKDEELVARREIAAEEQKKRDAFKARHQNNAKKPEEPTLGL